MDPKSFLKAKHNGYNIKARKDLKVKRNNNSADFITPNFANGCSAGCAYCVEKGTMISTPEGLVPVEQIQDGFVVLAFDSSTEQLVEAHVQGTFSREVEELIELEVDGGSIRVSLEHPFLVVRNGCKEWVQAQHLTEDDGLIIN